MKRPQSETARGGLDDLDAIKSAYKKAKAAYEGDKSNKELKKAKKAAKNKLKDAENAAAAKESIDHQITQLDSGDDSKNDADIESNRKDDGNDASDANTSSSSPNIKALEDAYQNALSAFKADKTNKDLRRAKTAARRALDAAIAASQPEGSKQLTCLDCSKLFLFTKEEQAKFRKMKWKEMPKRCESCKSSRVERLADQRSKLDGKKRNMCYAFQKGECPHGAKCKFSHNPNHAGGIKRRKRSFDKQEEALQKESGNENEVTHVEMTVAN
ncbi:hypothetical protein ACHAWT_005617 [Skeletonema menzelii]